MQVMELFSAMVQMSHLSSKLDLRFALCNAVPAWICTAFGTLVLVLADSNALKRTLATMLIALALHRIRSRCREDANQLQTLADVTPGQPSLPPLSPDLRTALNEAALGPIPYEQRNVWAKSGLDLRKGGDLCGV
eukprot:SAG31_NODE_1855_length_7064_cov_49.836324_1_plen_134_part_10